jgi:hypothetical protein
VISLVIQRESESAFSDDQRWQKRGCVDLVAARVWHEGLLSGKSRLWVSDDSLAGDGSHRQFQKQSIHGRISNCRSLGKIMKRAWGSRDPQASMVR